MLSIAIGPVALPVAPLLLLLSVWGASWLAARLTLRRRGDAALAAAAGNTVVNAALLGLLAARLAHLALNSDIYWAAPASAVDIRDGGWHALSGAAAGLAWLLWRGLRAPPLRRPLGIAVLTGAALWLAASAATGSRDAPTLDTLQRLSFTALDGGAVVNLPAAARSRPVVVNLWASWCGPCRQEMPLLAAAQQREAGIGFLFVNQGESASAVRAYLNDQGLSLSDILLDSGSTLGPAIGSRGLPSTLFFDAAGRQVDAHFGVLSAAGLESQLRKLRAVR